MVPATGAQASLLARRDSVSSSSPTTTVTPEEPALQAGMLALQSYRVVGQPEDLDGAKELALNDRYGFQWWILPLIGARALGAEKGQKEGKKGADKGIDNGFHRRQLRQSKTRDGLGNERPRHAADKTLTSRKCLTRLMAEVQTTLDFAATHFL